MVLGKEKILTKSLEVILHFVGSLPLKLPLTESILVLAACS